MSRKQEVFGKTPRPPALARKFCLLEERAVPLEQLILRSLSNWAKSIPEANTH